MLQHEKRKHMESLYVYIWYVKAEILLIRDDLDVSMTVRILIQRDFDS